MTTKNSITGDEIKSKALSAQGRANWDRIFAKKPAHIWAEEDGLVILDADGFDHIRDGNGVTTDTPITYAEYNKRIGYCTVIGHPNGKRKLF